MKFLFWNMQRLGSKTPTKRGEIMEGVLAEAFMVHHAEYAFLCEVSGSTSLGGVGITKQLDVHKRGARARSAQLGYGGVGADLNEVTLSRFEMPTFKDTFGRPTHRKGGNEFTRISKRFVAYAGDQSGVHLYLYHANASAKSAYLVAWVAEALRLEDDGDFLLVGDLNCTPSTVRSQLELLGADADEFEFGHDGKTHNAKTGVTKTYDYAIGGMGIVPVVTKLDIRPQVEAVSATPDEDMSDHLPIIVEF